MSCWNTVTNNKPVDIYKCMRESLSKGRGQQRRAGDPQEWGIFREMTSHKEPQREALNVKEGLPNLEVITKGLPTSIQMPTTGPQSTHSFLTNHIIPTSYKDFVETKYRRNIKKKINDTCWKMNEENLRGRLCIQSTCLQSTAYFSLHVPAAD